MKRLQKLQKLSQYLEHFTIEGATCGYVVTQADATSRLNSATGDNILLARPDLRQSGNNDFIRQDLSTAIFVLAKDLGAGRTDDLVNEEYNRLAELTDKVLEKIVEDCTNHRCGMMAGMNLISVDIVPEYSIFGGWNGYSIELKFE
jgi:hypothetical protein